MALAPAVAEWAPVVSDAFKCRPRPAMPVSFYNCCIKAASMQLNVWKQGWQHPVCRASLWRACRSCCGRRRPARQRGDKRSRFYAPLSSALHSLPTSHTAKPARPQAGGCRTGFWPRSRLPGAARWPLARCGQHAQAAQAAGALRWLQRASQRNPRRRRRQCRLAPSHCRHLRLHSQHSGTRWQQHIR